jgi:soluble lytic murein transglycosylase-like protein
MPRARTKNTYLDTAAPPQHNEGSGCLSGFTIVPLTVILISAILANIAWNYTTPPLSSPQPASAPAKLSPIFTAEVQHWANQISAWANAVSLNPNLVATVMQIESCGDPQAKSSAGAMGLFQVMPFHFHFTDNPYHPNTNAQRGLDYLTRSLEAANGDARLALAGYNGGIGVINRGEYTWHAQTKRYVQYGFPIYQDAINGLETSEALTEWYTKYGVSLCKQAHTRLGLP